jgi:3'(2'), 5'-bisphosphate nucleotidase
MLHRASQHLNSHLRHIARRLFSMSLVSSEAFSIEKRVAVAAVRRACLVTCTVFNQLVQDNTDTLRKEDESPVTGITIRPSNLEARTDQFRKVGDYAAQAVINTILKNAFPKDPIVGEEGADALRQESNARLRDRVVTLATNALNEDLIDGEDAEWGLGAQNELTSAALLKAIDEGNDTGGPNKRKIVEGF